MEQKLEHLTDNVNDIKNLIHTFNKTLGNIENRLARLEKVDSIEHRVAVNQIDLSDIKEALGRIEGVQSSIVKEIQQVKGQENSQDIQQINRRLDSHLVKLAKAEEEIIMLRSK
jgi:predicted  nucleic acid-binding Zn-ribbon protein